MSSGGARLPAETTPGTVIADRYRVERVLGLGGMGVVVEATHLGLDEPVALKLLLPQFASDGPLRARFVNEARAAARIDSEHVARVFDVGTTPSGVAYLAMELLRGRDLGRELAERGTLEPGAAVGVVIEAALGLSQAHSIGIVHRDVKPANLFLCRRQDGSEIVKVVDFGIAKALGSTAALTQTTAMIGTLAYMAPEQMRESKSVDARADVYALCATLFELLAGRPPFVAESAPALCAEVLAGERASLAALRPELPAGLVREIERGLSRDPAERHASMRELAAALSPYAPERARPTLARFFAAGVPPAQPLDVATGETLPAPARTGSAGALAAEPPVAAATTGVSRAGARHVRLWGLAVAVGAAVAGAAWLVSLTDPEVQTTPSSAGSPERDTRDSSAIHDGTREPQREGSRSAPTRSDAGAAIEAALERAQGLIVPTAVSDSTTIDRRDRLGSREATRTSTRAAALRARTKRARTPRVQREWYCNATLDNFYCRRTEQACREHFTRCERLRPWCFGTGEAMRCLRTLSLCEHNLPAFSDLRCAQPG